MLAHQTNAPQSALCSLRDRRACRAGGAALASARVARTLAAGRGAAACCCLGEDVLEADIERRVVGRGGGGVEEFSEL